MLATQWQSQVPIRTTSTPTTTASAAKTDRRTKQSKRCDPAGAATLESGLLQIIGVRRSIGGASEGIWIDSDIDSGVFVTEGRSDDGDSQRGTRLRTYLHLRSGSSTNGGTTLGRNMEQDPYDILGIPHDATLDEVEAAWRDLTWIYHPDQLAGAPESARQKAAERMSALNAARDQIRERRRSGESPTQPSNAGESARQAKRPHQSSTNDRRRDDTEAGPTSSTSTNWDRPDGDHSRTRAYISGAIAIAVLVGLIALGIFLPRLQSDSNDPEDYNAEVEANFIETCTDQGGDNLRDVCQCAYNSFEQNIPFDRFQRVDDRLSENPNADLPDDFLALYTDCVVRTQ